MQAIRQSQERGQARYPGLHSQHSFSFGHYYDPAHMGFGPLRVINQDRVAAGGGFPAHGHQDMEIISVILAGSMAHRDSLGHGSVIQAGDVQRMSAGTGIRHSEFNASATEDLEFLQIWVLPEETGLSPSYEQRSFDELQTNELTLVASRDGRAGAITVHQDVDLYRARLQPGHSIEHALAADRLAWVQVIAGRLAVGNAELQAGDGLAISHNRDLSLSTLGSDEAADFLLFDMARV